MIFEELAAWEDRMADELAIWVKAPGRSTLKPRLTAGTTKLRYVMMPNLDGANNCHHFAFSAFGGDPALYGAVALYGDDGAARRLNVSAYDATLLRAPGYAQRRAQTVRLYWPGAAAGAPVHSARQEVNGGLFWHRMMNVTGAVIGFPAHVTAQHLGYGAVEDVANVVTLFGDLDADARDTPAIDYDNISPSAGLKCILCKAAHGRSGSTVFGRWHRCRSCPAIYCCWCGDKLPQVGLLSRERRCTKNIRTRNARNEIVDTACTGITELIE
jgi:hypothetical protein